jgi:2-oxoglutarate dehydrogenase E2 component (dihydrolipoamide succinyltransferase)
MLVQVKVPALSESVAEATLLSWHKKQGEFVKRDENLIDIETDKVVLELPAPESGVLTKIVKADGGSVVANEIIAEIDTEAKGAAAAPAATEQPAKAAAPAPATAASASDTVIVMPAARKIAADKGIDAASLKGTGRGGRVTKEDVLTAGQGAPAPQAPAKPVSR